jgi:hypothetical protein
MSHQILNNLRIFCIFWAILFLGITIILPVGADMIKPKELIKLGIIFLSLCFIFGLIAALL